MNQWRFFFAGISLAILCACAAQQEVTTTPASPPAVKTSPPSPVKEAPVIQGANLPCTVVNSAEALTVSYPEESLYRNGAVLPKEEGLACLEALADWLKNAPTDHWQMIVSGENGQGFDPLALADKRQELLQRFFSRKGVGQDGWSWQTVTEQDLQLQLLEVKP